MNNPLNLSVLQGEIEGYAHAAAVIEGVSAPQRVAVARHMIGSLRLVANPQTPFNRGYRMRLDDIVRTASRA